ncbi:hypothetical protein MMC16_001139 [Acarospora aff. strigata]|nr:hypothetical protein [Acarospora aff. strigata]
MGWFGSLELAYKFGIVFGALLLATVTAGVIRLYLNRKKLRKHVRLASLEAGEKEGEKCEIQQRKLDEGDLFGIRAIESGYFGGVTQSRPTSAAGRHSPSGSSIQTFVGSQQSPKIISPSRSGRSVNLAVETNTRRGSSPLAQHVITREDDTTLPNTSTQTRLDATHFKLQPSSAELHGNSKHDRAVHMTWNVPSSPTADTSQRSSELSSPSSSSTETFQTAHHYHRASTTQLILPDDTHGSTRRVSTSQTLGQTIDPQTSSVISPNAGNSKALPSPQSQEPRPNYTVSWMPKVPPPTAGATGDRTPPASPELPPKTDDDSPFVQHRDRKRNSLGLGSTPRSPRVVSGVGDWGAEIFRAFEKAMNGQR